MGKYLVDKFCNEVFGVLEKLYAKIGFNVPWIGYFALNDGETVAVGGFKGPPQGGKVEIAYGTVPGKEGLGFATTVCQQLTHIALREDPQVRVTARTLMEEGPSTSILKKNGFKFIGEVEDPEDGRVWEWEFIGNIGAPKNTNLSEL